MSEIDLEEIVATDFPCLHPSVPLLQKGYPPYSYFFQNSYKKKLNCIYIK